jgi:1-deoxy-D-xylulose-5-phosphate synthase
MVGVAWEAACELDRIGIQTTVINARFAKPLDAQTICEAARTTGRIITIEENVQSGGFGEAVSRALHNAGLGHIPHTIIAIPDQFVEHGAQNLIRRDCGLCAANVLEQALKLVEVRV